MRALATSLLRWLAETLVRLYYPRRTVEGAEHVPPGGPALYVANHPNGLLDPLVLRVVTGRRIRFLAKSTLWGNPFGRLAMDAFQCLKVHRLQDAAAEAQGGPGSTTAGREASTPVRTRDRNEETFARCRAELALGAELALYPEGTSHAEPRLKPLKSGAARIALSAVAEAERTGGAAPVLIPVGSHYENQSVFRSGVHMVIGAPIDVSAAQAAFAVNARRGVDELTALIRTRLEELVLQAETEELLEGIARVASWTAAGPDDDGPARRAARTRELLAAYARLKTADPVRLEQIARAARSYGRVLRRLGVDDPWTLEVPRVTPAAVGRAIALALLLAPAGLIGLVGSWLPYRLSGVAASRMTRDEDVLSTIKMIVGAAFLAGTWLIQAVVVGLWLGGAWGLAWFVFAPAAGYAALRLGETLRGVAEALRHVGWRSRQATVRRLAERRRRLAEDVARALREAGA